MAQLQQILNGWGKLILKEFGLLPKELQELSEKRLLICDPCNRRSNDSCSLCGCTLAAKTLVPEAKCPENKW